MTSETAPPTIPSVSTGTPAGEWSQSVLASSAKVDTPAKVSTIPGALDLNIMEEPDPEPESKAPEKAEKQPEEGEGRQGSREATTTVPATLGTAAQTTKQQETAVSSQEEHHEHASMPSEELKGAQPHEHTAGVGALPGNISESSVALLPDERQGEKIPSTPPQSAGRDRRDTIKPTPATAVAAGSEQTQPRDLEKAEQAKISGEPEPPKEAPTPSIPADISTEASAEPIEAEAKKARLVETSKTDKGKKTSDAGQAVPTGGGAGEAAAVGSVGTGSDVGETGEKKQGKEPIAASAKADQGKGPTRDEGEEDNKQVRPTKPGYGGDYHPAQMHPPPQGASVSEYHTSGAAQEEEEPEAPPSPTQSKRASVGTGKKPGFMTKVKGEMKVLAGKMSGDGEKVAEGKKIMHKEE